jgi:hypothetical protein
VKGRGLAAGWVVVVLVILVVLGWTVAQMVSFRRLGAAAHAQRAALTRDVEASRQKTETELAANAGLLRDIRWNRDRGTAAEVLRRLADLARDGEAKVVAITPLEQEPGARYRRSSHRIDMVASFRELVDFAARVERGGGILDEVVLEVVRAKAGGDAGSDAIRAQFRLTTLEPSEDTRRIMDRVVAASAKTPKVSLVAALTRVSETRAEAPPAPLRDPFKYIEAPRRRSPGPVLARGPAAAPDVPPSAPVAVRGIVKFPGGALAIVNDQIVKVGDMVAGRRVHEIVDGKVVFTDATSGPTSVPLLDFSAVSTNTTTIRR